MLKTYRKGYLDINCALLETTGNLWNTLSEIYDFYRS